MKDGTRVTYGASGKVVYKAYRIDSDTWYNMYNLVPESGVGRKRYRVRETQLRPAVASEPVSVNTSQGKVSRPKTFRNRYPVYSGCTRRAYIGPEWVFKVAKYPGDNYKNRVEAARYAQQNGTPEEELVEKFGVDAVRALLRYRDVPIAECHLLPDGVLVMERVRSVNNLNVHEGAEELTYDEKHKLGYRRPDWACAVDCEQIGYNRKGELVAYDL